MKIIQLTAENVKKLKVVDITPKGHVIQVTGKNGNGKSSVLDSIFWALGGEKNIQEVPIRKGAESARIRLDLGDMIVERKFGKGEGLTVRNKTGAAAGTEDKKLPKYDSPQAILDALLGRLSFDPLEFSKKKPREQYDDLKSIAKIGLDIDAMEAANKADFAKRTDITRDAKATLARVDGSIPDDPKNPVDENAILDQIQEAAEHNSGIERAKAQTERFKRDAAEKRAESVRVRAKANDSIESLKKTIETLKSKIAETEQLIILAGVDAEERERVLLAEANDCEASVENDGPHDPIDVSALRTSLATAKATNAIIVRCGERDRIKKQATDLEAQAKVLTESIAEREKAVREAIERATMPIPELSLANGCVTFNGLPFAQASDAEQLRISVAIAMATNPTLRVIRVRNGSLLDEDGLAMMAALAKERDYQLWVERVESSGKIGIVMEDGEVAADHQEELELK